jgi:hypothetical protein
LSLVGIGGRHNEDVSVCSCGDLHSMAYSAKKGFVMSGSTSPSISVEPLLSAER